jgi:hypothetical protein
MQVPQTDSFLIEAGISSSVLEAYAADLAKEKAQHLTEHGGTNSKMAPLNNNLMLIATPLELKIVKLPEASDMRPFGQALNGMTTEAMPATPDVQQDPPRIRNDCNSYRTEAIGVYEGRLPNGAIRGRERIPGHVVVNIGRTDKPVKLVLSSYEPVAWQLHVSSDARLSEIFLSGSNESTVEGISQTQITYISNAYAYRAANYPVRGRHASRLDETVRQKTGCTIENFQGSYMGGIFHIGNQSAGNYTEGENFQKYRDEDGNVVFKNY